MNKLLTILILALFILPSSPSAKTRAFEKIATTDMKASDFRHQEEDCTVTNNRTVCAQILYHYEIDEQGRLYFAETTNYGTTDSGEAIQPELSASTLICQLDSTLKCNQPELSDQVLNLSAYSVNDQGVVVHEKVNPWANSQKAALFLPRISANVDSSTKVQNKMMDNLVCYMFNFAALVKEFKTNGRLIDDDSIALLKTDACMPSFQDICHDPGAKADQVNLGSIANADDANTSQKLAINSKDVDRFCNSIKPTKSAMLR